MMCNDEQRHPVMVSQVMIHFSQRHGVDRATCLLGTGISEQTLSGGEGFVTRAQEMRLIDNIMLALPNGPASGFELGLQYSLATFGVWGFALRASRTLRDAVGMGVRYLPLSTAYCRIALIDNDDEFGISLDPGGIPLHLRQFLLERDMATTINLVKELSLSSIAVNSVVFTGRPRVGADYIQAVCGVRPVFNGGRNSITVTRADAELPFSSYDQDLARLLEEQCRLRLRRMDATGLEGRVRQKLLGDMGLGATLDSMAGALALSPRSLRRKLEQEGVSYRQIVEEERKQLAIQLLENTDMKIEELAAHLGYTEAGGFVRAFRRWLDCSPRDYRGAASRRAK